jgi:hypothetical protein
MNAMEMLARQEKLLRSPEKVLYFPFVTPNHIFLAILFGYSVDGVPKGEENKEYARCTAEKGMSDLRGRTKGSLCKLQGP